MRVGILGPLTVKGDDGPVEVGGARLRALLIRLAIDEGRTVDSERLAEALWGDQAHARLGALAARRDVGPGACLIARVRRPVWGPVTSRFTFRHICTTVPETIHPDRKG
jgi:hypothetical protein